MVHAADSTGNFGIACWKAWAPAAADGAGWPAWLASTDRAHDAAQPDVGFLPAMLRRRLDRLGRMALHTAWPCAEGLDSVPVVFASRHGDLNRTLDLLTALAHNELLSPADFSLSVHNSGVGLFSIARRDRAAATALAAGADTLNMGLLEGVGQLAAGAERVLVCYVDDSIPETFAAHLTDEPAHLPFSVSMLLTQASGAPTPCRMVRHDGGADEAPETALMRFLLEGGTSSVIGVNQPWRLERSAHAG